MVKVNIVYVREVTTAVSQCGTASIRRESSSRRRNAVPFRAREAAVTFVGLLSFSLKVHRIFLVARTFTITRTVDGINVPQHG